MNKQKMSLLLKDNNQLYLHLNGVELEVHVKQCFPWSDPQNYFSLRDKEDSEVYLVNSFKDLDQQSEQVLRDYLSDVEMVMEITGIMLPELKR